MFVLNVVIRKFRFISGNQFSTHSFIVTPFELALVAVIERNVLQTEHNGAVVVRKNQLLQQLLKVGSMDST